MSETTKVCQTGHHTTLDEVKSEKAECEQINQRPYIYTKENAPANAHAELGADEYETGWHLSEFTLCTGKGSEFTELLSTEHARTQVAICARFYGLAYRLKPDSVAGFWDTYEVIDPADVGEYDSKVVYSSKTAAEDAAYNFGLKYTDSKFEASNNGSGQYVVVRTAKQ